MSRPDPAAFMRKGSLAAILLVTVLFSTVASSSHGAAGISSPNIAPADESLTGMPDYELRFFDRITGIADLTGTGQKALLVVGAGALAAAIVMLLRMHRLNTRLSGLSGPIPLSGVPLVVALWRQNRLEQRYRRIAAFSKDVTTARILSEARHELDAINSALRQGRIK